MTTSLKEWSVYASEDGSPLNESDKAYFRAKTRRHIHGVVLERFMELSDDDKISRATLAKRLGVGRAQITRWISSPGNWTFDTLSDLLLAMSCQASVMAEEIGNQTQGNYTHPASNPKPSRIAESAKGIYTHSDESEVVLHMDAPNIKNRSQSSKSVAA